MRRRRLAVATLAELVVSAKCVPRVPVRSVRTFITPTLAIVPRSGGTVAPAALLVCGPGPSSGSVNDTAGSGPEVTLARPSRVTLICSRTTAG